VAKFHRAAAPHSYFSQTLCAFLNVCEEGDFRFTLEDCAAGSSPVAEP
jgi:hypothetical protein